MPEIRFRVQYPETLEKGLAGQTSVKAPMLFVFPGTPTVRSMWMKGMLAPIDIVWINEEGTVTTVYTNVSPTPPDKTYSSVTPAKYAIETPAGASANLNLVPGASIRIFGNPPNVS